MSEMAVTVSVGGHEDGRTISLFMNNRDTGELLAFVNLEVGEITDLINGLAEARAALSDEVPREIDRGTRARATLDPAWHTKAIPEQSLVALALRHPGLGWLSFALPVPSAADLARRLESHSSPSAEPPSDPSSQPGSR